MKNFKLYIIHKKHRTLLTNFTLNSTSPQNSITYDEQLKESENDQFTLTFSMPRYLSFNSQSPQYNYWLNIVRMGSRLELVIDDRKLINFIVSSVAPALSRQNIVYSFTAQDEVSYRWSRINLGYSYPQREEDDDGAHNAYIHISRILRDNYLDNEWSIIYNSLTPEMYRTIRDSKFSFSIDNSNPYNAIVECCNVMGYKFYIDYNRKLIKLYIPEKNRFSGYRYRSEANTKSFSVSYDASNLCTLMHAIGGTDEYDQIIPLVPALPYAFKKFFSGKGQVEITIKDKEGNEQTVKKDWDKLTYSEAAKIDSIGRGLYTRILDNFISEELDYWGLDLDINNNHIVLVAPQATDTKQYKWLLGTGFKDPEKRKRQLQDEINECVTFAAIADKVPYLGQFLCDFSFFDNYHSKLLSSSDPIYEILNNMRVNNTWLKIYTPSYYSLLYDLVKTNAAIEALAEQYEAEWRLAAKKHNESSKSVTPDPTEDYGAMERASSYIEQINNLLTEEYFARYKEVYGTANELKYKPYSFLLWNPTSGEAVKDNYWLFPEWAAWQDKQSAAIESYESYEDKLEQLQYRYDIIIKDNTALNTDKITVESEIAATEQYIETYRTLLPTWNPYGDINIPGKYSLILGLIINKFGDHDASGVRGLADIIADYEGQNDWQSRTLYMLYSDYIYEQTYENADELDSVGLYNQTVNNFALYNKPTASYNLTTIDLNCLEQISIPDLAVGSKIKIYNEMLKLDDNKVNELNFTDNTLVVTEISRKLRSSDDVQLTVEKSNKIDTLIEKLLLNIRTY